MIKKLLGKRIKELRQKKHYTQEYLAEKLGMCERNLSKIECGVNFITADTLYNLTQILDVSAKDLFDFNHLKNTDEIKQELLNAINNNNVDIDLLYKIYQSISK